MGEHIHKRFTDEQVKSLLERYAEGKIKKEPIMEILKIKRSRFFKLVKEFKEDPNNFSINYKGEGSHNKISEEIEKSIIEELKEEKKLIEDSSMPTTEYNYSHVRDEIYRKYKQRVSVPTIVSRAKENDCYLPKKKKKAHDREVITNYIGEMIQHDSSHHRWSPYAHEKWYLITSLDDNSRRILYGDLFEKETAISHIEAFESVFLQFGLPVKYYVDSHSIFRFVQGRDSYWRKHNKLTDDVDPQCKQILKECGVDITYALSPQAKGKIERPYRWLQDRIVRTCAKEHISNISDARKVLRYELNRYNYHQVHSTTGEIPVLKFENALKEGNSLFREFKIIPPYQSIKDIFCIRIDKYVDGYRKISINNIHLRVPNAPLREKIQLRIYPLKDKKIHEIRFWYKNKLLDVQNLKFSDLNLIV